jgi:hypothetical protein
MVGMVLSLTGCDVTYDCYQLRREAPAIELVDRVGDPGVPYYDTSLIYSAGEFQDYPRCPSFDFMNANTTIELSEIAVGLEGRGCALMTANASVGDDDVPFALLIDNAVLFDASGLAPGERHLLLGSPDARFGPCTGYWLTVASGETEELYGDPGEGAFPPWRVSRLFRPNGDPGCPALEPCVDSFSARMVH